MSDITGNDIINAFEQAMDSVLPRISTRTGELIHRISYESNGRLAGQTHTSRAANTIQTSSQTYYWKWWLNGRGAVVPKRAKYLHYFTHGTEVFSKYSAPFGGHRKTIEPKYEEAAANELDNQIQRYIGML